MPFYDLDIVENQPEIFTISHKKLEPALTEIICLSRWQKSSFSPERLNALEGVYLTDVKALFSSHSDYSVLFKINNDTDETLRFDFPAFVILEKKINGEWYEVPFFGGALYHHMLYPAVQQTIDAHSESRTQAVDLNYWRQYSDGLYRIVTEVYFDSDSEVKYPLSENFEVTKQDFKTKSTDEQMSSFEDVSLSFVEYDYVNDILSCILNNDSEYSLTFILVFTLEKLYDGEWYEMPFNRISTDGETQGTVFPLETVLIPGGKHEEITRLRYWNPLSPGTYRLIKELYVNHDVPIEERELYFISEVFEIA